MPRGVKPYQASLLHQPVHVPAEDGASGEPHLGGHPGLADQCWAPAGGFDFPPDGLKHALNRTGHSGRSFCNGLSGRDNPQCSPCVGGQLPSALGPARHQPAILQASQAGLPAAEATGQPGGEGCRRERTHGRDGRYGLCGLRRAEGPPRKVRVQECQDETVGRSQLHIAPPGQPGPPVPVVASREGLPRPTPKSWSHVWSGRGASNIGVRREVCPCGMTKRPRQRLARPSAALRSAGRHAVPAAIVAISFPICAARRRERPHDAAPPAGPQQTQSEYGFRHIPQTSPRRRSCSARASPLAAHPGQA